MSSGIRGTYNKAAKTLTVTFRNGTYVCVGVPETVAAGFAAASSKGTYWNQFLKGKY